MSRRLVIPPLSFLIFLCFPWSYAQQQARVEFFSPQGTVKDVRQVTARFSEAVVPFGDPRAAVPPFEIDCPAKGTARWVDSRNWVYDFAADLEAGIRCEFRLRSGLKSLAGNEITGTRRFAFSTGGPSILSSRPWQGSERIDEEQAFILDLDAEAEEASVLSGVSFSVAGLASAVGVRIVTGKEREELINAEFRWRREKPKHLLVIRARQKFPQSAKVNLVWGKGVRTPGDVANDQDQVLPFVVRPNFTATFHCQREKPESMCVPVAPLRLEFSAPVLWSEARKALLKGSNGQQWKPQGDSPESEHEGFVHSVIFKGPFPERSAFTLQLPAGIKDDSGRALSNASSFPLTVQTDEYPPLAKFAADFGIVELNGGALLPVTLRNVEPSVAARILDVVEGQTNIDPVPANQTLPSLNGQMRGRVYKVPNNRAGQMLDWIRKVGDRNWDDREKSVFGAATAARTSRITIPKLAGPKAFEVLGIPLKSPGFYVVEIESEILGAQLLGKARPMYVATTALVTNMSVHFKWGRDASLVWVTTLDQARPVAGADVMVRDCTGEVRWQGKTDASGIARPTSLPARGKAEQCDPHEYRNGLLVTAQVGADLAFVHTNWSEGIEPWRFRLPMEWEDHPLAAHTIFDRTLFRAGETVHMKHILRERMSTGLRTVPPGTVKTLSIQHVGSSQTYELPLKWDASGIAESTWQIPADAKLGQYSVSVGPPWLNAGNFRVQEYRVPLMRAMVRPPAGNQVAPSNVPLDLTVTYLAGGPASGLPVRLRHEVHPRPYAAVETLENFTVANGRVKVGVTRDWEDSEEAVRTPDLHRIDLALDKSGSVRTTITGLKKSDVPQELLAELEYRDPNGEAQTVAAHIPIWHAERLVGIQPYSWILSKESLKLRMLVVDLAGKVVANAPVRVELFEKQTYSHRKRLVGGFYAWEHSTEVKRLSTFCEGKTDRLGQLFCEKPSPVSGNVIVQAVTRDGAGRESASHSEMWVAGTSDWWFRAEDGDRIDLIPEAHRYEPGDKAKFQVRMPFRTATALVTIEREGVIEAFVRELSGKEPVLEIPVKGDYTPNVFVSVLAVRGRVSDVAPTATIDLGRPACKLGIAEIRVGWRERELTVKVSSEKPVYHVREKAKVDIAVTTAEGKAPPAGSEIALAAVDEGLLELMPNDSWRLLEAMMGRRPYGVETSTAQLRVIGKRHFGLKALPQGGGGGRGMTRELFDTLLLWKGRVPLDVQGNAIVEVPLNDSITSFRIVAIATSGVDRFGTGSTSIRSTQDLILFSGVPLVARHGDRIRPEFTVRNASEHAMEVHVNGKVQGLAGSFAPIALSLAPGQSAPVSWDVVIPSGIESLRYEIEADGGVSARDRLAVTQKVVPAVPVRTIQATLAQAAGEFHTDVAAPADALPGQGGIQLQLRPKLVDGLGGVAEYMQKYPYTCLEQLVSRAIGLRDTALWKELMARLPSYIDSQGLLRYFPMSSLLGSDTLTAYVLSISHEAGWALPSELRTLMLAGLRGFVEGRVMRWSALPTADLAVRKVAALEALSRYEAVPPQLTSTFAIEPNLWPTSGVIDWSNMLRRTPVFPSRDARLAEADQILRSRLNLQGTTMGFSTERADFCWWLMVSPDSNAARIILSQLEAPGWKQDMPRMVRGALGRQRRGHWDTTVANAWGILAMEKFSQAFESTPVTGRTAASLAGASQTLDWAVSPKGRALSFPWPGQQSVLTVTTSGTGSPWVTVQSLAAIPLRAPLSTGFTIRKTFIPVEQKEKGSWTRGDIVRVHLELESQADMTWVVVNDPIPAGAAILGTGLARDSALSTRGERQEGWVWPAFEERSLEAFRSYFDYVPKGKWTVEYTVRLNSEGLMNLPTTRVEAMYSPEMFGEIPNEPMRIK